MATALASSVHHSILSNHVTRVQTQTRRSASSRVRCMAEEKKAQQPMKTNSSTNPPPTTPQNATPTFPPSPAAPKKMSTKFIDLLAFRGPAPERINGRLAMIGFVAALGVELARGSDVFAQLADGGFSWFVITSVVLSVASLIPLSQGVSVESKSGDLMSSRAEMWNGRAAMLGLVALVLTEVAKGFAPATSTILSGGWTLSQSTNSRRPYQKGLFLLSLFFIFSSFLSVLLYIDSANIFSPTQRQIFV